MYFYTHSMMRSKIRTKSLKVFFKKPSLHFPVCCSLLVLTHELMKMKIKREHNDLVRHCQRLQTTTFFLTFSLLLSRKSLFSFQFEVEKKISLTSLSWWCCEDVSCRFYLIFEGPVDFFVVVISRAKNAHFILLFYLSSSH